MIVGALLSVIVLILFLKDIRPTLVIACSIPLSVIFAVVLMVFFKYFLKHYLVVGTGAWHRYACG